MGNLGEQLVRERRIQPVTFRPVQLYSGSEVADFRGIQQYRHARLISQTLGEHPYTMQQVGPYALITSMQEENTVVAMDDQEQLYAFARTEPSFADGTTYICGSWVGIRPGFGMQVMQGIARLAMSKPNARRAEANVAVRNTGAQAVMEKLGAKRGEEKDSAHVFGGDGKPGRIIVFDVSNI